MSDQVHRRQSLERLRAELAWLCRQAEHQRDEAVAAAFASVAAHNPAAVQLGDVDLDAALTATTHLAAVHDLRDFVERFATAIEQTRFPSEVES